MTRRRAFLLLWAGQFLSGLGSGMTAFALGVVAFRQTGAVSDFALVVMAFFVPAIVAKPLGGILADRYNRRILMIAGDAGGAIAVSALIRIASAPTVNLGAAAVIVAMVSLFSAFRDPAYKSSVTDFLREAEYSRGGGLVQLASASQHVLSPLLAGVLLSIGSITAVLLVDVATFSIAIVATAFVLQSAFGGDPDPPPPERKPDLVAAPGALRSGLRTICRSPAVPRVVLVIAGVTVAVGYMQTIFQPLLLLTLDAAEVGSVQSLAASGMIASSVLLGTVTVTNEYRRMLALGLVGVATGMAAVGLATSLAVTVIALAVVFISLPFVNTSADVIIRSRIPNAAQGRVWGLIGVITQSGYVLAYLTAGTLVDRVFEPAMQPNGALAASVGRLIGTGPGRGMGLMLALAGIGVALLVIPLLALPLRNERRHAEEVAV